MFWVEYIIVNSVIQAKECHIQVSPLPNTHVVVKFAIKLKIPHWRIMTIEIDMKSYFKIIQMQSVDWYRLISILTSLRNVCVEKFFLFRLQNMFSQNIFCFFNEKDIIKGTRGWLYLDSLIANVKFFVVKCQAHDKYSVKDTTRGHILSLGHFGTATFSISFVSLNCNVYVPN